MPLTTATRNEEIRAYGRRHSYRIPARGWMQQSTNRDVVETLAASYRISETTVRNILRGRDLNPPASRRPRSQAAPVGRRLGTSRRFGVEIEFMGVARSRVQATIDAHLPGWKVKTDVSVNYANGVPGLELVSPPLAGQSGLDQVRLACTKLEELGAQVNRSCGLHVHHEARDLGAEGIALVAELYAAHQGLINWLVSPSRREARYARPLDTGDLSEIRRSAARGTAYCSDRYKVVNVNAFGRHGTVEIRQHQGTLSFRKIEAWILMGQGFMDAAVSRTRLSHTGLRGLLSAVADEDSAAYLLGRALQFGAPASVVAS